MEQTVQAQVQLRDLNYLLQTIVRKYDPLQIYRFHMDEASRKVEGCFSDNQTNGHCDYWLLMVMDAKSRIENAVQDFVNAHYEFGKVTVLAHSKDGIESSINDGYKFFINVFNTGKLLYNKQFAVDTTFDSASAMLVDPERSKLLCLQGISRAEGFLYGAIECFENKKFSVSAFMLHQTVEQCCIALIRYHMDYRCDIHNLFRLLMMCRCFSEVPYSLLMYGNEEGRVAFDKVVKSYSNARYGAEFSIEAFEIELLVGKISELVNYTKGL